MFKPCQPVFFVIVFFLSSHTFTHAQLNLSNWQFGVNAGMFIYQGDLTPSRMGSYKTWRPAFGLNISRVLSPSFLARVNFAFGSLKGNDAAYNDPAWRKERSFNFSSSVKEISALLVWNIFGNNGNVYDRRFSPYLFGGVGLNFLKVKRDYSNFNAAFFGDTADIQTGLTADQAKTPPRTLLVIPAGVGLEYYLNPHLSLLAETNFRYTTTDYLDGFSKAADPLKNDYYHSHTIGLIYKFGKKDQLGCPVMKN